VNDTGHSCSDFCEILRRQSKGRSRQITFKESQFLGGHELNIDPILDEGSPLALVYACGRAIERIDDRDLPLREQMSKYVTAESPGSPCDENGLVAGYFGCGTALGECLSVFVNHRFHRRRTMSELERRIRPRNHSSQKLAKGSNSWLTVDEIIWKGSDFGFVGRSESMEDGIAYPRCLQAEKVVNTNLAKPCCPVPVASMLKYIPFIRWGMNHYLCHHPSHEIDAGGDIKFLWGSQMCLGRSLDAVVDVADLVVVFLERRLSARSPFRTKLNGLGWIGNKYQLNALSKKNGSKSNTSCLFEYSRMTGSKLVGFVYRRPGTSQKYFKAESLTD
jgi:hypothetical protein